jgi:hypothetical protein
MNKESTLLEKGKKRVRYVAISVLIFSLLGQVISVLAAEHTSVDTARLVLTLALLHYLYKGHNWARRLTIILYALALLLCIAYFFLSPELIERAVFLVVGVWLVHILYMLRGTPEILAYFEKKKTQKQSA